MTYLVFDIETRIDKALLRSVLHRGDTVSDEDAYQRLREGQRLQYGDDFIPTSFHVPISIALGSVESDYVLRQVEVLRAEDGGEDEIVRQFWSRLETFDGTLVSFNGRGFDLPVLELQALRHGVSAPRYFGERNGLRSRFGRHLDLYDFLTNTGAVRLRGGFDLAARLAGLPGKGKVAGGDVQSLWEQGRVEEVHRYCADDVIQTYFLFLEIERLRGKLSPQRLTEVQQASASFFARLNAARA
jgi:3'-5' exonuclease